MTETDREEFLTPEDFGGKVENLDLEKINNHPIGDADRGREVEEQKRLDNLNTKKELRELYGDLLTEPDENSYQQTRRILKGRQKRSELPCKENGVNGNNRKSESWTKEAWYNYIHNS